MKEDKIRNENTVPLLDLAPRLKRPLSLWNPLDYLRLLYWAFFFPQAIQWYIENFSNFGYYEEYNSEKEVFRKGPIQRKLIVQFFLIHIFISVIFTWVLNDYGASIDGYALAGCIIGVILGMMLIAIGGYSFGLVSGLMVNFFFGKLMKGAITFLIALLHGDKLGISGVLVFGDADDAVLLIIINIFLFRYFDYIFLVLPGYFLWKFRKKGRFRQGSRVVFIPTLPGLKKQLQKYLETDWAAGLHNASQMLAYTRHFIPVIKSINDTLSNSPADMLLPRTAELADKPINWILAQFGITKLNNRLKLKLFWEFSFLSIIDYSMHLLFPSEPQPLLDTPAHAACAGFWYWHEHETDNAAEAFAVVKDLPHGPELYGIARSIVQGENATDLETIAAWEQGSLWLDALPPTVLRPGTLEALRTLRTVACEARAAYHSEAPLNRSTAIGRANAALTLLIDKDESSCQQPEWPLIKEIAEEWRDILNEAGGVIGEEVLRQPVLNPYEGYSGLPVTGSTFMGRTDIMRKIENHWATSGQPASIILYGHRRMGKTSVLRNLANRTDANMLYVYLNMQDSGWVDHTGQLLLDFAEALHRASVKAGLQAGPPPDEASYTNLGTGRRAFNTLLDKLNPQMSGSKRLVLAIDEFELIETGIQEKRIDAGLLPYLRAVVQEYQWLGLIFAGLHTLDEMGRDYQSAFFGQAEYIRVGYLPYSDALRLITQPHPDFALEYTPELRDELYRLTYGQPYLLQRLCWEMVTRWNERFLKQGETTPRSLTQDDLAMALTPDFYLSAGYYFDGVWTNVTENERILMAVIAEREKSTWTAVELAEAVESLPSFKESNALEETLQLLRRHDVILEEKGGLRIASELTRRWITRQKTQKSE